MRHQYIERHSGKVKTEKLHGDRILKLVFAREREDSSLLYRALTSRRVSDFLAYINFDSVLGSKIAGSARFLEDMGVNLAECLDNPEELDTPRAVFERKIRYWDCRPMPDDEGVVVSPCDARMLAGSLDAASALFLKDKFFSLEELLGEDRSALQTLFKDGDHAVFRLTPEKYHYNHCPVSGEVEHIYTLDGVYGPCNPACAIQLITPYSKNRRVVTIINTDVKGCSRLGRVAMVEIVALMVGDIQQAYSHERYSLPRTLKPGMFIQRGQPKSLFKPGSSTVVLLFEKGRIVFSRDIIANMHKPAHSRYSQGLGRPLVETDVPVRSGIARRKGGSFSWKIGSSLHL